MSVFVQQQHSVCDFADSSSWIILSPIEQSIKRKIESVGTPLKEWDINIYRGVLTGYNEAFIISTEKRNEILANCRSEDERKKTAELIRPILRGRDIKRYGYEWANLYLIATFPSRHYDIEEYPAVKNHLLSYGRERLEQTGKTYTINGEKVKARKRTNNKWFETQDSISYWEDFSKPKIVWIELTDESKFALSIDGVIPLNTIFCMVGEHIKYLLAIINSSLIHWYYLLSLGARSGVGTNRWLKYTVECIPVPLPTNDTKWNELIDSVSNSKLKDFDTTDLENAINHEVYSLYGLTDKEIKYIEKTLL